MVMITENIAVIQNGAVIDKYNYVYWIKQK